MPARDRVKVPMQGSTLAIRMHRWVTDPVGAPTKVSASTKVTVRVQGHTVLEETGAEPSHCDRKGVSDSPRHALPTFLIARTSKILVVDDEPKIRRIVASYRTDARYDVSEAADGATALTMAEKNPDLVILDVGLPGIEVLRELRTRSTVPVILLTARTEETDRLIGLSVGADDYVTKPLSPRELVLRVKAILRRVEALAEPGNGSRLFESLEIDLASQSVLVDGSEVELTALEFDLLVALADVPGTVLTRRQLIDQV